MHIGWSLVHVYSIGVRQATKFLLSNAWNLQYMIGVAKPFSYT